MQVTKRQSPEAAIAVLRRPRPSAWRAPYLTRAESARGPDFATSVSRMAPYLGLVLRWMAAAVLLAWLWLLWTAPVYESNMLIQVEEDSPAAQRNSLTEMATVFDKKAAPLAEMELLRSRLVVAQAVEQLQLDIEIQPRYLPLLGALSARYGWRAQALPLAPGYVWGRQPAQVARLEVPAAWLGRPLRLTALPGQRLRLDDPSGRFLLEGAAGAELSGDSGAGPVRLRMAALQALPGVQFDLVRQPRQVAVEALQKALQVSEQGKMSGIIDVRLEGTQPARISAILGVLGQAFAEQNLARKQEAAAKSLGFIDDKLPSLTQRLEQNEARLRQLRAHYGSIDLAEEARLGLQQEALQRQRRDELEQKRIELLARFTPEHPQLRALDQQMAAVDARLARQAEYLRSLPQVEQELVRLQRDIRQDSELVSSLSKTAEQLGIAAVGKISNVRLVDVPLTPDLPLRPRPLLTLGWAALTGLFCGVLAALARHAWRGALGDAEAVAALLGAQAVCASIPHSRAQDELARAGGLLARAAPTDPALEALRSLRAALLHGLPHFHNNVVLLAGVTAGVGQAFVLANLAALLGAAGKRVALIDAHLRGGHLHRYFKLAPRPGLADALAGARALESILHLSVCDGVDFIGAGAPAEEGGEVLLHLNFSQLLETLSASYDLVLIGTAPLLESADALAVGSRAGAVFVLTHAASTREDELQEALQRLNQAGVPPQGIVCNGVAPRLGTAAAGARRLRFGAA